VLVAEATGLGRSSLYLLFLSMASGSGAVRDMLPLFEAWAANFDPPDDFRAKAQSGKSFGFALIGKEADPNKLYEVAVIHYGDLEELYKEHFVKVIAKTAAGSPGDTKQVVFGVHTSLFSQNSPYSSSVLSNPSAAPKFNPLRVWLAPSEVFNRLDRVFVNRIEPVPREWATHGEQITNRAIASPPTRETLKQGNKSHRKTKKHSKRRRSSSVSSSSSESASSDEDRSRSLTRAEQAAESHKVRSYITLSLIRRVHARNTGCKMQLAAPGKARSAVDIKQERCTNPVD
jgi:hypothetical protein